MMRRIAVLGFGGPACRKTFRSIEETARELGIEIDLEKVSDPARIAGYRMLSAPGVVMDGRLVHQGSAPNRTIISAWLTDQTHSQEERS